MVAMATHDMLRSGGGFTTRQRFSLLHLDEGEDYVGDFVGLCKAPTGALPRAPESTAAHAHGKLRGRIRLLSRSLVFDPDDLAVPMLKFHLAAVSRMDATGGIHAAFELVCSRCARFFFLYLGVCHVGGIGSHAKFADTATCIRAARDREVSCTLPCPPTRPHSRPRRRRPAESSPQNISPVLTPSL